MMLEILLLSLCRSAFGEVIDLTYPFDNATIYWPTAKRFGLEKVFEGVTESGFFYAANNLEAAEHGGTHIDAPFHFASAGQTLEEVPLNRLIGRAFVIDVSSKASEDTDYLVQPADLPNGANVTGRIVLVHTGWGRFWPDETTYLGTSDRNASKLHFPGISSELAKTLVEERAKAVGIDTASIDHCPSKDFAAHQVLSAVNVPIFENVAHLHQLVGRDDLVVVALPMNIAGGWNRGTAAHRCGLSR